MRSSIAFGIAVSFILLYSVSAQDCEFIDGDSCSHDKFEVGCCSNTQMAVCGKGGQNIEIIQCQSPAICALLPSGEPNCVTPEKL